MTARIVSVLFVLLLLVPLTSSADITEQGTGMLFGADHAFFITAAKGWVLDNESGVQQGLYMTFYPVGYTWANSPVIAYGRKVSKDAQMRSAKDMVESTVKMFHEKGSPGYKVVKETSVALANGKKVPVYYYAGDQWGNFEAAAYFEEKNTINFLVYNSRKKSDFDRYLPGFEQMVRSYWSRGNAEPVDDAAFKKLVQEAKRMSETPGGKEYEEKLIKRAGERIAIFMRDCASYVGTDKTGPFEAVFRIKPDGSISEAYVSPANAFSTCFEGFFLQTKHPSHQFDSYLLHIDMKIKLSMSRAMVKGAPL